MKKRKLSKCGHRSMSQSSSSIVCGECGGFYGSKLWRSNDKYRKIIWQRNAKLMQACEKVILSLIDTKAIDDEIVKLEEE